MRSVRRRKRAGVSLAGIEIRSPSEEAELEVFGERYYQLARAKGTSEDEARQIVADPIYFAACMVLTDDAAGYVAGAQHTTAETVRPAIRILGTQPGVKWVSSFFLMVLPDDEGEYVFADCAVIPDPDTNQLVEIARLAAANARVFLETEPARSPTILLDQGECDSSRGQEGRRSGGNSKGTLADAGKRWGAAGRRGPGGRSGGEQSSGESGRREGEHARVPRPELREYRLQAGPAARECGGAGTHFAGPR